MLRKLLDIFIQLILSKVQVENVLVLLSTRNHALLEFSAILGHDVGAVRLSLELHGCVEVCANNFVGDEVVNSLFDLAVGLSGNADDVFDEISIVILEPLSTNQILLSPYNFRNVFQNQNVFLNPFLLEKFCNIFGRLDRVNNQVPHNLSQADFDRDVVLLVDRLDQLIQLAKVAFASPFQLVEGLVEFCVLGSDVFVDLDFFQGKFFFEHGLFTVLKAIFELLVGLLGHFSLLQELLKSLLLLRNLLLKFILVRAELSSVLCLSDLVLHLLDLLQGTLFLSIKHFELAFKLGPLSFDLSISDLDLGFDFEVFVPGTSLLLELFRFIQLLLYLLKIFFGFSHGFFKIGFPLI